MKKTKAKIVAYDPEIYPVYLYVGTVECLNEANKLFDGYDTMQDASNDQNPGDIVVSNDKVDGVTVCVREKKTGAVGLLVLINTKLAKNTVSEVVPHESVHVADGIFDYLGIVKSNYEHGNEHYAYLVGWVAGRISNYLINYTNKENNNGTDNEI